MKRIILLSVVMASLLIGSPVLSQPGGGWGNRGGMGRGGGPLAQLNLTPEQRQALRGVMDPATRQAHRDEMQRKFDAVRTLMVDPNASESSIRAAHADFVATRSALAEARLNKLLAIRKILTPEQLNTFLAQFGPGKMKGQRQGRGPLQQGLE